MITRIRSVVLRRLQLPLSKPYQLSYRTFREFQPIVVEVRDGSDRIGFGEGHISPGSSAETREGGWALCRELAPTFIGCELDRAKAIIGARVATSPVAATAMITAIEMLESHPVLSRPGALRLPLSTPLGGREEADIVAEVEARLADGFRTFKVKVGSDASADARRLYLVQRATKGRAAIRVDANRGFSVEEALRFVDMVDWRGIELFEQPCRAEDWAGNGGVAMTCPVPVMLDEPICSVADIERAADMPGIGYCKVKLKRFGSLDRLLQAIERAKTLGLKIVLGDGLSSDIGCWMEACVAAHAVEGTAGEFNGFLKPKARILTNPYPLVEGSLTLPKSYWPEVDSGQLDAATTARLDSS